MNKLESPSLQDRLLYRDDKVLILETCEQIDVTRVDAQKRAMASAIELFATGVA